MFEPSHAIGHFLLYYQQFILVYDAQHGKQNTVVKWVFFRRFPTREFGEKHRKAQDPSLSHLSPLKPFHSRALPIPHVLKATLKHTAILLNKYKALANYTYILYFPPQSTQPPRRNILFIKLKGVE